MTKKDWIELERILTGRTKYPRKRRRAELLEMTRKESEHPEWYSAWCECKTCVSYADA